MTTIPKQKASAGRVCLSSTSTRVTSMRSSPPTNWTPASWPAPAKHWSAGTEFARCWPRLIDAKTRLHSRVVETVTVGDIAQLYTDFEGTTVDTSGNTVAIHHKAIEVLRRQPDGAWKLIVGDPNGRE
jgi:hypothetical protein